MTLDDKVKQALDEIGSLAYTSKALNRAKTPEEKGNLYLGAAQAMGGKENYLDALEQLGVNEGVAYAKIKQASAERVKEIKDDYLSNKDTIQETVEQKLNEGLRDAENKYDAVRKLSVYLAPLLDIPEIDQSMADKIKAKDLAGKLKMGLITGVRGSIDEANDIYLRTQLAGYIKEVEGDGRIRYSVDKEKLGKLMDNIETGAYLYSLATQVSADDYMRSLEAVPEEAVRVEQ